MKCKSRHFFSNNFIDKVDGAIFAFKMSDVCNHEFAVGIEEVVVGDFYKLNP